MSVIGVLAHFGGNPNDWWIELGLPVVILVALYVWSTRGERKTRKDVERRQQIGEATDYRALSDEDLSALLAVGGGSPTPEAQRLRADARAELERRGVRLIP